MNSLDQPSKKKRKMVEIGNPKFVNNRELDLRSIRGDVGDRMAENLYKRLSCSNIWPDRTEEILIERSPHGGIFNLGFSPDGSILGAACEKNSLLFFDPLTKRNIQTIENAHANCVNVVKFLDNRVFATCADDNTVRLWDYRMIKQSKPIRSFHGHTSWVKNIDYLPSDGVLLTSGFDDVVFAWNINKYSENAESEFKRVLHVPGLIRTKLTHDSSKFILSSNGGYIFIFHNFHLQSLIDDLPDFKPSLCWAMLNTGVNIPPTIRYAHLAQFEAARNRAELIDDFAPNDDAQNITSIQPHPYDWCLVSRNTASDGYSEWTCVHDIQMPPVEQLWDEKERDDSSSSTSSAAVRAQSSSSSASSTEPSTSQLATSIANVLNRRPAATAARRGTPRRGAYQAGTSIHHRNPPLDAAAIIRQIFEDELRGTPKTFRRLTHYIDEESSGREYIKELSWSHDGLVIASPYAHTIRLFAFDQHCSELRRVTPLRPFEYSRQRTPIEYEPVKLFDMGIRVSHRSTVLCSQFSPVHHLLVTGCLNGKVAFYEPGFLVR